MQHFSSHISKHGVLLELIEGVIHLEGWDCM